MNDQLRANVSAKAFANITRWLEEPKYEVYRAELQKMINRQAWQELEDGFFDTISFGTAGIRGTTGIGSNRINLVTLGEAAQGLAEYALAVEPEAADKGIAIACDTRLTSEEFSKYVAEVIAANGVKVYLFESFRATPELSFAVRHLGCIAGVVISASHNPPADNGFKAYWSDGGQLIAPHDKAVIEAAAAVTEVKRTNFDGAIHDGRIVVVGQEIDDSYINTAANQAVGTERAVKIVYSPLHGAGQRNTLPILRKAGFEDIITVDSQMVPDGNFPTIENGKPNPEEKAANDRAVAEMLARDADIAITNDPDADRVGVMVRQGEDVIYLSGNQAAVLATEYAIRKLHEAGELGNPHFIAKTIVTTEMLRAVADRYGVTTYSDMLIGFKYISELLRSKENGEETFIIGAEESFGLLKGSYARDKDGATGALPLAEYAADLKLEGKTLYDRLLELYTEYGIYIERLDTIVCPGSKGFEQMQSIMTQMRKRPPQKIGSHTITATIDYQTLTRRDLSTGETSQVQCSDTGNVVVLEFGDPRRRITVRPSGTEPKLKLYVQWFEDAPAGTSAVRQSYSHLNTTLESLARELEGILLEG